MKKILMTGILMILCSFTFGQKKQAKLSGQVDFLKDGEEVVLKIHSYGYMAGALDFDKTYKSIVKSGHFEFTIDIDPHPYFFYLGLSKTRLEKNVFNQLIEPGDDIIVYTDGNSHSYSGIGSKKMQVIDKVKSMTMITSNGINYDSSNDVLKNFRLKDSIALAGYLYIENNKNALSPDTYQMLKEEIAGGYLEKSYYYTSYKTGPEAAQFIEQINQYKGTRVLDSLVQSINSKSPKTILFSIAFTSGILQKYLLDTCYLPGKSFHLNRYIAYLKRNFKGAFLEKLTTYALYQYRQDQDSFSFTTNAIAEASNTDFKEFLLRFSQSALEGVSAYNFDLPDAFGKKWKLSDFKGKVVVLDFWYTGCPACKETAPILRTVEKKLAGTDVVFVTVSIDRSDSLWKASLNAEAYSAKDNINLRTEGKGKDHEVIKNYNVTGYPTLFLIDKSGKVMRTPSDPRLDDGLNLIEQIKKSI